MALGRTDRAQLRQQLGAVEGPIKIDYFHQRKRQVVVPGRPERPTCELAIELYTELAAFSDKLTLNVYELADEPEMAAKRDAMDVPCAVVRGELNRPLRLYGLPNGHVFVALVRAIVLASTRSGKPSAQMKRVLGKLRRPSRLRLFASPEDPVCGQAALMCWATSLLSPKLQTDVIMIDEFAPLAQRAGVSVVPTTFVDDQYPITGIVDPIELAQYVGMVQSRPSRARLNPPQPQPGTVHPWRPPPPPQGSRRGPPPSPRELDPIAQAAGRAREAATPEGMRRTTGGLIVPDR